MYTMNDPETTFYNDIPESEHAYLVSNLRRCPAITLLTPLTNPGYLYVPSTYLICTLDQAIPEPVQRVMVQRAREIGAVIDEEEVASSE